MNKYKLTKITKEWCGIRFYQIEALKDFNIVVKGEKGGWVEKEDNLSQDGDAWVYGDARVYGDAQVYGDAWVSGNAQVYGNARVYGDAWVYGDARVSDNAQVYGDAQVYGNARVSDNAQVSGNAWVYGNARVYGDAWVYGDARVYGDAQVYGDAWVSGNAQVYGELKLISGYFYHTKQKTEKVEMIENNEDYETLCSNPKLGEEEKPKGKKVRIRLAEGNIVEGEIIED